MTFDLDTFIKLFVNHRPVYGIGKPHIEKAFESICLKDETILSSENLL